MLTEEQMEAERARAKAEKEQKHKALIRSIIIKWVIAVVALAVAIVAFVLYLAPLIKWFDNEPEATKAGVTTSVTSSVETGTKTGTETGK